MTDMDDALAQDNLMMLKIADQAQDLELQAADQIESLVGNSSINISAPGSSSLITAAAVSAEIKSQAIMQKMMAAMMRQEAGRVAHDNALRKRTATFAGQLQNNMTNVLQHSEGGNRMRDHIIVWIGKAKEQAIRAGRCVRRHTVLVAVRLAADCCSLSPRKSRGSFQVRVVQSSRRVWERSTARWAALSAAACRRSTRFCRISATLNRL